MSHPVIALTLGSSHVDANPEQQEEHSKAHEERGHQRDEELFVDIPSVFGGGDLVTGRAIKEKQRGGWRGSGQRGPRGDLDSGAPTTLPAPMKKMKPRGVRSHS